ncbi:glycoside hydrolase family 32 protein [Paenibacillus antri]|uniref:Sucrose-6-phosphate hydrolase n=1 Tax=Paenibacillus antri TaxID=2582848 RepID=A0A5R9GF48_9BACL|nr:glycoside hydrolase family 32 protein [Paenibacillus antri]TLS52760.1 glycoside hydrolase family 32 protein [Paenibacillus antri]
MSNHEEQLRRANDSVAAEAPRAAASKHRLAYHIMAPAYWMNDPNGLVQFNGQYHVFFQHHPYGSSHGPMHWGHVRSDDLVHWEHLPIAIAPTDEYDRGGCYSGSAVVDDNGELVLIYSGHANDRDPKEVQCIARSKDGIRFEKSANNPVVPVAPREGSADFRDPKVWKHEDAWYMVVGTRKGDIGKVVLYESPDLERWRYVGVLAESDGTQGFMWECPDLFPLGDKHVMILSPMGMGGKNNSNVYIVGEMDYISGRFKQEYVADLDAGVDFYAAQTFHDDRGRRILIAWMDMWGMEMPTQRDNWAGALTLPRELSLLPSGRLAQRPVRELESLRGRTFDAGRLTIGEGSAYRCEELQSDRLEVVCAIDLSASTAAHWSLEVRGADGEEVCTSIRYDASRNTLVMDRWNKGENVGLTRECPVPSCDGNELRLHLFLDRSSAELFAGAGDAVMTNRMYPAADRFQVRLVPEDGDLVVSELRLWELEAVWK